MRKVDYLIIRQLRELKEKLKRGEILEPKEISRFLDDVLADFEGRRARQKNERISQENIAFRARGAVVGYDAKHHKRMREGDFADCKEREAFKAKIEAQNQRRRENQSPQFKASQFKPKQA